MTGYLVLDSFQCTFFYTGRKPMWVKKYAPTSFHSVIGNEDIVKRFKKSTDNNYMQHMIIYGRSGIGKNTLLMLMLKEVLGAHFDEATLIFSSVDSKNNQSVREKVHQFAPIQISSGTKKFIVFKQSEQLSDGVQQIMRRLMELHYHHTIFVFVCNSMDNLLETIQSRCHIFHFKPMSISDQIQRLQMIAEKEHIVIQHEHTSEHVCRKIANMSQGDLRFSMNYFQAVCTTLPVVNGKRVLNESSLIQNCFFPYYDDVHNIFTLLLKPKKSTTDFMKCIHITKQLNQYGYCGLDITFFFSNYIVSNRVPKDQSTDWLKCIALCQNRMTHGVDSQIQLVYLVSSMFIDDTK